VLVINWLNAHQVTSTGIVPVAADAPDGESQPQPAASSSSGLFSAELIDLIALLASDTANKPKRRRF